MCWPYTLIYGCMDCFAEGRSPTEACIVVPPGAEDPVVGGYNREGDICPLRYIGQRELSVTPISCPSLVASSLHGTVDASTAYKAFPGTLSAISSNDSYDHGCPQLRFWICKLHRPKYLQLGPSFAGFELARRNELVDERRKAEALKIEKRNEKKERWNEAFKALSDPQPYLSQKRKREAAGKEAAGKEAEAEATINIAAATHTLLEAAEGSRSERKRHRRHTAGSDISRP
ncbi:hypothetical protein F4818DRAFT_239749 [Hypoxylon cercidicola]|nr:hypothetical protein F4818DRAFT_239749 [Hypoxylon cercidicola]